MMRAVAEVTDTDTDHRPTREDNDMTTTRRDLRDQLTLILASSEGTYDVEAILDDLIQWFDLTGDDPTNTLDTLDHDVFWRTILAHDTDPDEVREAQTAIVRRILNSYPTGADQAVTDLATLGVDPSVLQRGAAGHHAYVREVMRRLVIKLYGENEGA